MEASQAEYLAFVSVRIFPNPEDYALIDKALVWEITRLML